MFFSRQMETSAAIEIWCGASNFVHLIVSKAYHPATNWGMIILEEDRIVKIPYDCIEEKIEIRGGEVQIFIGKNPKLNLEVILSGQGASLNLQGVFFGKNKAAQDLKLLVIQRAPQTTARVNFRAALNDSSFSIFDCLIRMEKEAVDSIGMLSYKALLLSSGARSRPTPKLEVLTKKVAAASHAASVGKIEENQLFYLQSRGISLTEAKKLIVEGFLKI